MAEGTSLLRMHTAYTCIVSSNLTVSARKLLQAGSRSPKTRIAHHEHAGFLLHAVP